MVISETVSEPSEESTEYLLPLVLTATPLKNHCIAPEYGVGSVMVVEKVCRRDTLPLDMSV